MVDRVSVSFSKDYSKVIIFNYKAGSEPTDVYFYEIEPKTGNEISKRNLRDMEWKSIADLFAEFTAVQIDYFKYISGLVRIESPDKKYLLEGNKTYGNFVLMTIIGNKAIRKFRFASDIE